MADKTILDFTELTDNQDNDSMYVLRGTGTGRDRWSSRLNFLQDILLFGTPIWTIDREYAENTGMAQDEGMVWASSVAANVGNKPSTNQDKWGPVSAPTEKKAVAASGAIVFGFRNFVMSVDLSGGNVSIPILDVPNFVGQRLDFVGAGAAICDIAAGNGLDAIAFTEDSGLISIVAVSATEWRVVNDSIGKTQTWQIVTGSRALGVTYTNTTGKPIELAIKGSFAAGAFNVTVTANIDGVSVIFGSGSSPSGNTSVGGTIIVPNGSTYNLSMVSASLNNWAELR